MYFLKYRRGFSRILLRSLAVIIPSIRQVTHRKPPFYSSFTKRFSCNGLSTGPPAEALHEQDTVNLKKSILYSEQEKVAVEGNEREKGIYSFTFSLGIKETVLIWILELEVEKSQITV